MGMTKARFEIEKKYFDQLRLIRTFVRSGRLRVNSITLLVKGYNFIKSHLQT